MPQWCSGGAVRIQNEDFWPVSLSLRAIRLKRGSVIPKTIRNLGDSRIRSAGLRIDIPESLALIAVFVVSRGPQSSAQR